MATRRTVVLKTRAQREVEYSRDHDSRPYVRARGGAVLKSAGGETPPAVAPPGLLKPRDPDPRSGWLQGYADEGVAGLVAPHHGGERRRSLRGARSRARGTA